MAMTLLISTAAIAQAVHRNATPKELAAIKEGMATMLKDADSAKFRNVFVDDKTGMACGMVNAKNGMGGYTGFTYFMATVWPMPKGSPPNIGVLGIDADDETSWQQQCEEKRLTAR
ncbi:hypothetical protein RHOFW104T7_10680 [Rhodanobacter thiooxydans]|uniref:Uncharacterized protein n=2 Tax=Rhodanobacter TaxID=75309 RepID=A0A154QIR3_9GAMM|nr:hypothetical protein RHOFW104T7_10680 [Rhodanobacter thiooxydans]